MGQGSAAKKYVYVCLNGLSGFGGLLKLGPVAVAALMLVAHTAKADTVLYDSAPANGSTYSGYAVNGGTSPAVGYSNAIANEITLAPGSAGAVTGFEFSMLNLNSSTLSASPIIAFYADDGSGQPGAVLATFRFNAISMAADNYGFFTYASGSSLFTAPQTLWVAESFTFIGTSTTAAQLNNFGVIYEDAASVGSDGSQYFISSSGSAGTASSPAGSLYATSGTAGTLGIELLGPTAAVSPTPEPGTIPLMATGLAFVAEVVRRKRRLA